jgi:AcrR family transcriptional regulator
MARWEPGSRDRLAEAAVELFAEHGFRSVSVAQIAEHAGVTERTFYRHFASKEDVLFVDGEAILTLILDTIDAASGTATPAQILVAATAALAEDFQPERARHRNRAKVIASDPALLERDLFKQYAWGEAIAERLHRRGASLPRATVLATAATAAFRTAYVGWCRDRLSIPLSTRVQTSLEDLVVDLTT